MQVIAGVMHILSMQIPPYVRIDLFRIIFNQFRCSSGIFFSNSWFIGVYVQPYEKYMFDKPFH